MIEEGGGRVDPIEEGHNPGGVSTHNELHLNYPMPTNPFVYASETMKLELDWPLPLDANIGLTGFSNPDTSYCIEDLLWRAGQRKHLFTWPKRPETNEAARAWFETVAALLKQHARDLLAGEPGAFRSLAAAAEERERLLMEENDRRYELAQGQPEPPRP